MSRMDVVRYSMFLDRPSNEAGSIAAHLVNEGIEGHRTHALFLADYLQDHSSPVAELIRRIGNGEGVEETAENRLTVPNERDAVRVMSHGSVEPSVPNFMPYITRQKEGDTANTYVRYVNSPSGHFWNVRFRHRGTDAYREFWLPTTPEEVRTIGTSLMNSDDPYDKETGHNIHRAAGYPAGHQETAPVPYPTDGPREVDENPGHAPDLMSRLPRGAVRRYAVLPHRTPVSQVLSQPIGTYPLQGDKINRDLLPVLSGSRLALVLSEIRDKYGEMDQHLKQLAEDGLGGVFARGGRDTFKQIRDRLLEHASGRAGPMFAGVRGAQTGWARRAQQLAENYNWHRVGKKLNMDGAVAQFVNQVAKTHLKEKGIQFRAAHNVFGHGSQTYKGRASETARLQFLQALTNHLKAQGHGSVAEKDIWDSLNRLAGNEETSARMRQASPTTKVGAINPSKPAWGKDATGRVRARTGIEAHQFHRTPFSCRGVVRRYAVAPNQFIGYEGYNPFRGIYYSSHPRGQAGGYSDKDHLAAQMEHSAVMNGLRTLGVLPPRPATMSVPRYDEEVVAPMVNHYVGLLRQHVRQNPRDILSRHYLRTAQKVKTASEGEGDAQSGYSLQPLPVSPFDLMTAVTPLIRHYAEQQGHLPATPVWQPVPGGASLPVEQPEAEPQFEVHEPGMIDLSEPHYWADLEDYAKGVLDQPTEQTPQRRPFGYGQQIPTDQQHSEADFAPAPGTPPSRVAVHPTPNTPEIYEPNLPHMEGESPVIQAVEKHRGLRPLAERKAIFQTISDHDEQGWSAEKPLLDTLVEKHGLDPTEAKKHIGNYRRLKQKPAPTMQHEPLDPRPYTRMGVRRYASGKTKETGEALREVAFHLNDELELGPDYNRLFWNPETKSVWYTTADSDDEETVKKVREALEAVPGVSEVRLEAECNPPEDSTGWFNMYDRNNQDEGWKPWPPKEKKSRRTGVRRYMGETTEEQFQQMLDANPDDHQTRGVLADFLEDKGDPRAAGYRAMHRLQVRPYRTIHRNDAGAPWLIGSDKNPDLEHNHLPYPNVGFPHDWLQLVNNTHPIYGQHRYPEVYWSYHKNRREAENEAALAFSKLPPERQQEISAQVPDDTIGHMRTHPDGPLEGGGPPRHNIVPGRLFRRLRVKRYGPPFRPHYAPDPEPNPDEPNYDDQGAPQPMRCFNCRKVYPSTHYEDDPTQDGVVCPGCGWTGWPEHAEDEWDEPEQYDAYRSPKGGMVVRGTHYPGGEMIPDMTGAFANPPVKKPRPRGTQPVKMEQGDGGISGTLPGGTTPIDQTAGRAAVRKRVKMGRHLDFNNAADAEPTNTHYSQMYSDALRDEGKEAHA